MIKSLLFILFHFASTMSFLSYRMIGYIVT